MSNSGEQFIYILKLRGGKQYVGKTNDVVARYTEHREGVGCAFTRKYTPVRLLYQEKVKTQFDEDNKVKELMMKQGIENVRGGS